MISRLTGVPDCFIQSLETIVLELGTDGMTEMLDVQSTGSEEVETRERLLSEAVRMFAAEGDDGTSVRKITESAGANVAAVSYYFGGKEGLYRAVLGRVFDEMRERRIRRIEADLEAAPGAVSLEEFLESFAVAFVEPLV